MRTKNKKWPIFIILLLVMGFLAVACDAGEDDSEVEAEQTVVTTPTVIAETEEPAVVETPTAELEATEVPPAEETPMEEEATAEVMEEPSPAATETTEPTATVMAEPTTAITDTAGITGTVDITETIDITDTMAMTGTNTILASDFVGLNVENEAEEAIGEVSEILVDVQGNVQYVLFDIGGFLGIDTKTVAVPWGDLEITEVPTDTAEIGMQLLYAGEATALEEMPAFDTAVLTDEEGYFLDATESDLDSAYDGLLQIGEFEDYNLLNTADEDLGEVEDLILDLSDGTLSYAVVDFGGFLGLAENTVAVPWSRLLLSEENDNFILDVAQEMFEDAPTLDLSTWTYPVEPQWDEEIISFWEAM